MKNKYLNILYKFIGFSLLIGIPIGISLYNNPSNQPPLIEVNEDTLPSLPPVENPSIEQDFSDLEEPINDESLDY